MAPFRPEDLAFDEAGFRRNLLYWTGPLGIDGVFVAGKQGEFFSMPLARRKRNFDIAADALCGRAGTIMSCSGQNMDTVLELADHAQAIGADFIIVPAPLLHFLSDRDDTLYQYYKHISERVEIGIAARSGTLQMTIPRFRWSRSPRWSPAAPCSPPAPPRWRCPPFCVPKPAN